MEFIRRYILHNIALKLLALGIAVLLWLAVARDPMAEIAFSVPIEFHNAPEHLEISSETLPQVQVRLRGPVRVLRELAPSEIHAMIDLADARVPGRTYDMSAKRVRVPSDVDVVQVIPSQFHLSFDQRDTKKIDVHPRVTGSLAPGYRIASIEVAPKQITITGPASHVNQVDSAITDPVDASGVVGQAAFTTHASIPDPLVRIVNPEPVQITVSTERVRNR